MRRGPATGSGMGEGQCTWQTVRTSPRIFLAATDPHFRLRRPQPGPAPSKCLQRDPSLTLPPNHLADPNKPRGSGKLPWEEMGTWFQPPPLPEMDLCANNDKYFGESHRWPLVLATLASPSSAWLCLGLQDPAPSPKEPSSHIPLHPKSKLWSRISEWQCRLLQTLLPNQGGKGDRAALRTRAVPHPLHWELPEEGGCPALQTMACSSP